MNTYFFDRIRAALLLGVAAGLLGGAAFTTLTHPPAAQAQPAKSSTNAVDTAALQAELAALKGQLPDQAHAMADVGQHFANLWFAAQRRNWPLARFYLDETHSHLNWAVRLKTAAGQDIDLRGILQAIENTQLAEVRQAVEGKDAPKFAAAYRLTLEACFACHKASEKPYLRPQVPERPEMQIINFDPEAKWPE